MVTTMGTSIQIFASDHRKNINWEFPFIRVTDNYDSAVNIVNDKFLFDTRDYLSEISRMMYAYKHLADFGNPDFVGFCHYRRFFANIVGVPAIVVEDHARKYHDKVLTPTQQHNIMVHNNIQAIVEFPFYDIAEHS